MEQKAIMMGYTTPPTLEEIQEIAEEVVSGLPKGLKKYIGKLKIEIEDFPDEFIEQEMELESLFDLLGYYQSSNPAAVGGNITNTKKRQDVLCLFRRPLLDAWSETGEDITDLINRIVLQEIGNHFGFSDGEIEILEEEMALSSGILIA